MNISFNEGEMEKFLLQNGYKLETIMTSDEIEIYFIKVAWKDVRPDWIESHPEMYKMEGVFYQEIKNKLLNL